MKIAHIVPVGVKPTGDFHMMLLHLCNNKQYTDVYAEASGYKVLDNSVVELGNALSIEALCSEAVRLGVNEIILPDSLGNGPETVVKALQSLRYITDTYGFKPPFKIMAVAQGSSEPEWLQCYLELSKLPIHVIGIPKRVEIFMPRLSLCEHLEGIRDKSKEHHLLGVPGNPIEIWHANRLEYIRSVDSCIAYIAARDEVYIDAGIGCERPANTICFEDAVREDTLKILKHNVDVLQGWVNP